MILPKMLKKTLSKKLSELNQISRKKAEALIKEQGVLLNGVKETRPYISVTSNDDIKFQKQNNKKINLVLFHKPKGCITSRKDEKDRTVVYDYLPKKFANYHYIGRLDYNSEGLLLLTNSGELKRKLELPSSQLGRIYRVRVKGQPKESDLDLLRTGISVEKDFFKPMKVSIDRQQGANAWMTIEIKEGKNREIRRALSEIGMQVNRLIRVEYGPFKLGNIKKGEIIEINKKSMRRSLKSVNINVARENIRQSTEQKKFSAVSRKTSNKR